MDYEGDIELEFTLNFIPIKNSPVTISVEPAAGAPISPETIGGVIAAFLSLLIGGSFSFYRQKRKTQMRTLQLELEHEQEQGKLLRAQSGLKKENKNLQESLRKKKHSEDELEVMKAALNSLERKQKDELKEVLIDSSEVKFERLLGKGGFGVVNLATYRSQKVAMKQLLTINEESVRRFR